MAQSDVFALLKSKPGKEFTSREVADELNIDIGSANEKLRKILRFKQIFRRPYQRQGGGHPSYMYWYDGDMA